MENIINKKNSGKQKESFLVNFLLNYMVSGLKESEQDKEKNLIRLTKSNRIATFERTFKCFIWWFICSGLLLLILNFLNFKIALQAIKIPVEIINTAFSALLGALIGYILTDGMDSLDDWFDKDIIDEYIIKDVDRKVALNDDKDKLDNSYFEYPDREIIKYVYKPNNDNEKTPDNSKDKDNQQVEIEHYEECKDLGELKQIRKYLFYKLNLPSKNHNSLTVILYFCHVEYKSEQRNPYIHVNALLCSKNNNPNVKTLCKSLNKAFGKHSHSQEASPNRFDSIYTDYLMGSISKQSKNVSQPVDEFEKKLKHEKQKLLVDYLNGKSKCKEDVKKVEKEKLDSLKDNALSEEEKSALYPSSDYFKVKIKIDNLILKQSLKGTESSLQLVSEKIAEALFIINDLLSNINEQEKPQNNDSSEELKNHVNSIAKKLEIQINDIGGGLKTQIDGVTEAINNQDTKTSEVLEDDNLLEIMISGEYFFNHIQYKTKYPLGYAIVKNLIETKNMKSDEIKNLVEDLKKNNYDANQKEIIKEEGDGQFSDKWFDEPVLSSDKKKFYIIKYWSKDNISNLMEVLYKKKLLSSITYKWL